MRKIYAAFLFIAFLFSGSVMQAQNKTDKELLDLVRTNSGLLHISPADADNALISHSFVDSKTNIRYVYLQQAYQGIKVYNSIMTIIFRDHDVLYSSGKFVDDLAAKAGSSSPAIQASQAVSNAALHLKLPLPSGLSSVENKFATEKKIIFSPAGIAKQNIETELLWVASDDGSSVKLAWNVNIDEARSSDWWNVRIDAATGAYLEKNNFTVSEKRSIETDQLPGYINTGAVTSVETDAPGQAIVAGQNNKTYQQYSPPSVTSATYFISKQPSESPRHDPMVSVTNPWLAAGAGNPAITNGWHFDGTTNYNITRGNNVHAYLDIANTNNPASPGNIPATSTTPDPSLTFNFIPNFTQQPNATVNRQAAITNLFYWNNTVHDITYQYGFDEKSGNFQTDNLGRGGTGNDYVQAEAQDASGTDNANFSTPADGQRPRMQMFLWAGTPTFTVNTPAVVAGNYFAAESAVSTANKLINVGAKTGQVVYYNDDGTPAGTHYACNGTTPGLLTGKIAMIIRGGGCTGGFIEKIKNAQNAGAIAVIMVNNVAGFPITMGGTDNTITIPAVMISQADGTLLAAQLANNLNVTLAPGVGIDGDFDNGVVTHEYGHGVSNRLTGGAPNSGCLGNAEQGGEGWSDYLALMLTTNWATALTTDGPKARPMGVYAVGQPLNGTGIRTYPYSTDMTINPHTYANVANPTYAGEVHYIGEIWCATIWDMTWNIIQQEGTINPNIYDGTVNAGNSIALKLVLEGMRLQTCRPGFLDARDGILAADSILYNGRHKCAIWNAFARRGMGFSASEGSSASTTDGVVAFDVPSLVHLDKTSTPLTVVQGELLKLDLKATCQCLVNTNLTLRDTIPAGFTYVSSTGGGVLAGNVVTFPTINFASTQETRSYSIIVTPSIAGCALATNINDNRDGSTIGGFASVIATGTTNWVTSTARSSSPATSWFAASNTANRDFSLTSAAAGFTGGPLSIFAFKHFFITKNTIDGGRVEYSTDGGTNWLDAAPFIIQGGYNNTCSVANTFGVGQKMFGGVSYGRASGQFISTVVNFSSLSAQNVRVRLRARGNTTNQGTFEGWYVDDLKQMSGCGGIFKAGLYSGANRIDSLAVPAFIKTDIALTITTQPTAVIACVGSNAVFTVAGNAPALPGYQWQVSTDGGTTYTDIPGQTGATLTIPATLALNGNRYRAYVFSGISSGFLISNGVLLTVGPAPTITTQPVTKTVCMNTNVTFTAAGTNIVSYQWQQWNGTAWVNIASATSASYTVNSSAVTMNTNTFRVLMTAVCTTLTSATASLYVNTLPILTLSTSHSTALLPGEFVTVTANTNPSGGSYVWFKNGVILSGATTNSLTGLSVDNTGTYKVVYTDPNGCVSTSADITITAAASDKLYVYPNPNLGQFHVRFYNLPNEAVTLKVYDSKGAVIYQKQFVTTNAYSTLDVDLGPTLSSGVYLVEVRNAAGNLAGAKRVIVRHP